jgi:type II secretory pathway pseudopilin PulG
LQFAEAARQAQLVQAKATVKTLADAVQMFYLRNGRLPGSLAALTKAENGGPFVQRLEPDPWGNAFLLVGKTKDDFAVLSFGPDGVGSSEDDLSSRSKR